MEQLLQARDMIAAMPDSRQGHLGAIYSALGEVYLDLKETKKSLAAFETARDLILKHYEKTKIMRMFASESLC